jgi:hypothetical protein
VTQWASQRPALLAAGVENVREPKKLEASKMPVNHADSLPEKDDTTNLTRFHTQPIF